MIDQTAITTFCAVVFQGLSGSAAVRIFAEKGTERQSPREVWFPIDAELPAGIAQAAEQAAAAGMACFVIPGAVPAGCAKADDVQAFYSVLVDLDTGPIAAKREHLARHIGEPTLEVASGGLTEAGEEKLHLHWRLESPATREAVCMVRGALAACVDGDASFSRAHQPVRVPGSVHGKHGAKRPVRIIAARPLQYSGADIADRVKRAPKLTAAPPPDVDDEPIVLFMQRVFRPGGLDGATRFQAVSRVAAHFAGLVVGGSVTPEAARVQLLEWKRTHIEGDYPDDKATRSLVGLIREFGRRKNEQTNEPPGMQSWALDMVARYGDELLFCEEVGGWSVWSGVIWRRDRTGEALDLAGEIVRERAAAFMDKPSTYFKMTSSGTIAGVERIARTNRSVAAFAEEFDRDPMLLNTPGGVVDLQTGTVRAAKRTDYLTRVAGATPSGGCPLFQEFLHRIMDGDDELIGYVQRWFGYNLTGLTGEHVASFWYGGGANGKSIGLGVLRGILGDYSTSFPSQVLMAARHERHPEELARLHGARAAITSEVDQHARFDEAKLKLLTGGDELTGRFMRQNTFTFKPAFKITIAGNHKPRISNVDEAMRRRLHLVPFTVTIPPEQRDKQLAAKLAAEYGGILLWALEGCAGYLANGLHPPARVVSATDEWFDDEDRLGSFLAARCVLDPNERDSIKAIWAAYDQWAREAGETWRMTARDLAADLRKRGFEDCYAGRDKGLRGIRVLALPERVFAARP